MLCNGHLIVPKEHLTIARRFNAGNSLKLKKSRRDEQCKEHLIFVAQTEIFPGLFLCNSCVSWFINPVFP